MAGNDVCAGESLVWRRDADQRHEESCTHGLAILILSNLAPDLKLKLKAQMAEHLRRAYIFVGEPGEDEGSVSKWFVGPGNRRLGGS
jgi:hypothetical protein